MFYRYKKAFSLVEILVVIAILSILAALLLPAFVLAKEKAQRASCLSNLKQIGSALEMYRQDFDGYFPYAVDPLDRNTPLADIPFPTSFQQQIPFLPQINEVLRPYSSQQIFRCPADTGFDFDDRTGQPLDARPTSYEKFKTSYYYRTELAALKVHESSLSQATQFNVFFDGTGRWHAGGLDMLSRYNVLFADGHAKNLTRAQLDEAWAISTQ